MRGGGKDPAVPLTWPPLAQNLEHARTPRGRRSHARERSSEHRGGPVHRRPLPDELGRV